MRLATEENIVGVFDVLVISVAVAGMLHSTIHVFANVSPTVHCLCLHLYILG